MANKPHQATDVAVRDTTARDAEKSPHPLAVVASKEVLAQMDSAPLDDYSRAEVSIPFLGILQPLSPQLNPSMPTFIEGSKVGQIFNSVTKELYDTVDVVVAYAKRSFIEWVPRSAGGGFRGEYGPEKEPEYDKLLTAARAKRAAANEKENGRAILPNNNELVDTRSFFVLRLVEEGGLAQPAVVSMSSTQTKVARDWLQMMNMYQPIGLPPKRYPLFAGVYRLSTRQRQNAAGFWYVFNPARLGFNNNPDLVSQALAFRENILGGAIVVDREADADATGTDTSSM
jgi:hypothetical protein